MPGPGTSPVSRCATRAGRWLVLHPSLLFALWAAWLALEYVGLGASSFVRMQDNGDQFVPARILQGRALLGGDLGWWTREWVAGSDTFAAGLSNDADSLLYAVLPGWLAHGLWMWLQRFVAGYFMFRLARDRLGLGAAACLFAALPYATFAESAAFDWAGFTLYHGLAVPGIPAVLWMSARCTEAGGIRPTLVAAALGGGLAMTSSPHFAVFVFPAVAGWLLFIECREFMRTAVFCVAFGSAWALAEAPVLWASLVNAGLSHRAVGPPPRVVQLLVQTRGCFTGQPLSVGLLLTGVAMKRTRGRRAIVLALALAALVAAGVALRIATVHFGSLSGFNSSRILIVLFPVTALVGGAVGLDAIVGLARGWLRRRAGPGQAASSETLTVLVALAVAVANLGESLAIKRRTLALLASGSNYAAVYENDQLRDLAAMRDPANPFRVITLPELYRHPDLGAGWWLVPPVHPWAHGLETADGYMVLYPKRYKSFWRRVIAPLEERSPVRAHQFDAWGNQVYVLPPVGGFPGLSVRLADWCSLDLLSLANVRFVISATPIEDARLRLRECGGRERQLEWAARTTTQKLVGLVTEGNPGRALYVYENPGCLPRAFVCRGVRVFADPSSTLDALGAASLDELRSTAFVTASDADGLSAEEAAGHGGDVVIRTYTSDRIVLDVDVERPRTLVVTNSFSPFWTARVDGVAAAVFPVDHAFQGVRLPAGKHAVQLAYEPPYSFR